MDKLDLMLKALCVKLLTKEELLQLAEELKKLDEDKQGSL